MMRLLSHLVLGCLCSLLVVEASLATAPNIENIDIAQTSTKSNLTLEERQYVLAECKEFSKEDGISQEHLPAYLKTCFEELSAAVQIAIDELKTSPESITVNTN